MGWADDMYDSGYTTIHGGTIDDSDSNYDVDFNSEKNNSSIKNSKPFVGFEINEPKLTKKILSDVFKIIDYPEPIWYKIIFIDNEKNKVLLNSLDEPYTFSLGEDETDIKDIITFSEMFGTDRWPGLAVLELDELKDKNNIIQYSLSETIPLDNRIKSHFFLKSKVRGILFLEKYKDVIINHVLLCKVIKIYSDYDLYTVRIYKGSEYIDSFLLNKNNSHYLVENNINVKVIDINYETHSLKLSEETS